jgi:cobalt-zinc-cadmium efflux system outer membrane protein
MTETELLAAPGVPEDLALPAPRESSPPPATDTLRVSLDEAVAMTLAHRPAAQAAADRVLAAEAASRQARAWRNPEAIMEVEGFGGDRPGFDEAEVTVGIAGGFDLFGRAAAGGRVADAALQTERAERLTTHRRLAGQTRLAFHGLLAAQERLRIATIVVEIARYTREAIQREVEAGKTAELRGIQAETSLETARLRHEAALTGVDLARTRLSWLLSGDDASPRPVVAEGELRSSLPPVDPQELEEEVVALHPEIVRDLWRAEVQNRRAEQVGRDRWPELGFLVGYRSIPELEIHDWVGGLSVELPLLDRQQEAAREARRLRSAALDDASETALDRMGELERGWEASRAASALLETYDAEVLPRAEESLRLVRLGYAEGKFGYLDLVNAQRALADSQAERARAWIDLDRALTELEILLGRTLIPSSDTKEN